jgi:hypothetical protein
VTLQDGITIDMDASLPPWEKIFIRRNGFTYWGNIGGYQFQEGDETLTWDNDHNSCWKKVLGKTSHQWNNKLVRIKTETGKVVTVTTNHSIFGIKKGIKTNKVCQLNADNLQVGDYVIGLKQFETDGKLLPQVNQIYTDTVGLEKIKSIEYIDYNGEVFDISVEETERFFSGTGIGCHNTALYPSMMLQYNISFDSIFGRVIDPVCYEFLHILNKNIGTGVPFKPGLFDKLLSLSKSYVQKLSPQNKGEYTQYVYYMLSHLVTKLSEKNIHISKLMKPEIREHYIYLRMYLIPLIDLITEIHDKSEEYNTFAHDYLLNGNSNVQHIWIIEDVAEPNVRINRVLVPEFQQYLTDNNLTFNLAGTLLYTHEHKPGLYSAFLKNILELRGSYKNKRDTFKEGSDEYKFYDMRQLATKVVANSTYGLMGQSTFRYSDKWVAKTITVNGRLTLKISQICGEMFLNNQLGG